tara:strand:+ start:41565 stop:42860 length:1296 start_codon:yes stop_codon:yes gene_type:complete
MIEHQRASRITSFLIYLVAIATVGLLVERHQTFILFAGFFSAFFCYLWIVILEKNIYWLIGLGVLVRIILFFHLPNLSDDIFRFLWDGKLIQEGINPFVFKPNDLQEIDPTLYELLNSQTHYTVYPPLNQAMFWMASTIGNQNYLLGTNVIRSFLFLADLGSVFLLMKLASIYGRPTNIAAWYFLNPLVVLEFVGNIHFEGLVIFFLLLAIYALSKNHYVSGGLAMGLAAATKLIPLIFLPFLMLKNRWKNGVLLSAISLIILVATLLPLILPGSFFGFKESLMLYSNKFEFNASIYFIVREIGWLLKGYNPIETWGPWLSVSTFISIMLFSLYAAKNNWKIPNALLWILMIYLLLATTVHPWYVLTLLPLGLLSGFYFPVAWSLVVFITYMGYGKDGYELSLWWVVMEYVVVLGIAAAELFVKEQKLKNG